MADKGYRLGKTLGSGQFAKVIEAYEQPQSGNNKVAIKIIDLKYVHQEYAEKFFPRELSVLKKVRHPHIVRMIVHFIINEKAFLVLEHYGQGDLLSTINDDETYFRLTPEVARKWSCQLCEAVEYLHRLGIVHRDLKMENVLISTNFNIKISDFSFARELVGVTHLSDTYCGSYAYTCPEILKCVQYDPHKADVWSLGVLIFGLLNRLMPFPNHPSPVVIIRFQLGRRYRWSNNLHLLPRRHERIFAMDLVDSMLSPAESLRPCLSDSVKHPWFYPCRGAALINPDEAFSIWKRNKC